MSSYPIQSVKTTPPSLDELASSIAAGLKENFAESSCTVETPPDLTKAPYHLAGPLSGSPRVIDTGGPPYLLPAPDGNRRYDMTTLAVEAGMSPETDFILGAGALEEVLMEVRAEPTQTMALLDGFFSQIYPDFPILEQERLTEFFNEVMAGDNENEVDAALCLVVLALGDLAISRQLRFSQTEPELATDYFLAAYQILLTHWMTSFYLERPLQAWRLIHLASTKLHIILAQAKAHDLSDHVGVTISRLAWTCYVLECDSLAEFHLPRSGIELIVERMPFPRFDDQRDDRGISFLAICSVRRLLNRIHHAVYANIRTPAAAMTVEAPGSTTSNYSNQLSPASSLEHVCIELARQLDIWYHSLPESIKPDLSINCPRSLQEGLLRLRYWSANHIIYRPCLISAADMTDPQQVPAFILQSSEICVQACRNYIETAAFVLQYRTQYTWTTIQAVLSASLVLVIAHKSPCLRKLVPNISEVGRKVIITVQRWATPGSSAESIGWMLNMICQKQRLSNPSGKLRTVIT